MQFLHFHRVWRLRLVHSLLVLELKFQYETSPNECSTVPNGLTVTLATAHELRELDRTNKLLESSCIHKNSIALHSE